MEFVGMVYIRYILVLQKDMFRNQEKLEDISSFPKTPRFHFYQYTPYQIVHYLPVFVGYLTIQNHREHHGYLKYYYQLILLVFSCEFERLREQDNQEDQSLNTMKSCNANFYLSKYNHNAHVALFH